MARPKKNASANTTATKRKVGRPKKNPVVEEVKAEETKIEEAQATVEIAEEIIAEPVAEPVQAEEAKTEEVKVETEEIPAEETKVEEIVVEVPEKKKRGRKPASEKTATTKKTAKTTAKATANAKAKAEPKESKAPETKAYIQGAGAERSFEELAETAKKLSGVKSPKSINLYIKPYEDDGVAKVYYVVDHKAGHFNLF